MSSIADLLRVLNGGTGEMYCKVCTVDAVDEDKRVCDVSPIDGSAPLLDVNLQANKDSKHGIVVVPKKDSYVVVGFLTPDVGVVVLTDEIDRVDVKIEQTTIVVDKDGVVFNGGENMGLVKIKELEDNLKSLKDFVDAIHTAVPLAFAAVGAAMASSGSAGATSYENALNGKSIKFKSMENDKVKH